VINESDRDALVEYRLQQAVDTIELAKFWLRTKNM